MTVSLSPAFSHLLSWAGLFLVFGLCVWAVGAAAVRRPPGAEDPKPSFSDEGPGGPSQP